MPETGRIDEQTAAGHRPYAFLPDVDLTECLRSEAPVAQSAVQELRRRHLPWVLAYARLCSDNQVAERQLTVQAFGKAEDEVLRGIDPLGTWRHHALTLVRHVAVTWSSDSRRVRLRPDFTTWLSAATVVSVPGTPGTDTTVAVEEPDALLTGFCQLPELERGALWYSLVDEEPDERVATYLGVRPDEVQRLRDKACDAVRDAYVQAHLDHHGSKECHGFRRIIEAAAVPGSERRSGDLERHLAECRHCARLLTGLTGMAYDLRTTLAEGLLVWGGAQYTAYGPVRNLSGFPEMESGEPRVTPRPRTPPSPRPHLGGRLPRAGRRGLHAVIAALALIATALLARYTVGSGPADDGNAAADRPPAPSATVSGPSTATEPRPSRRSATKSPTVRPSPIPTGVSTLVTNVRSGLCLDVENQVVAKHVDTVAAPCNGGPTQRWSFDTGGLLRNADDPNFCLKADSDAQGVGIRPCFSADPEKRSRMVFLIGQDGTVRPRFKPALALTPGKVSSAGPVPLTLKKRTGADDQQWSAGTPSPG
ncbi:ricin-type beta-trefoil lectin domain protein [Streptomyces cucumeris]|uniref:ricin-type beta-trefoil lectin domain protein n=1 Tax=Streptomyces cucumeris TaxID=2962890 RepID=UPI003D73C5A8